MKLPKPRRRSKKAKAMGAIRSTPGKAIAALALIAGVGAALARKLKRGGEPDPFARPAYEPDAAAGSTVAGAVPPVGAATGPVDEPVGENGTGAEMTDAVAAEVPPEASAADAAPEAAPAEGSEDEPRSD